MNPGPTADDLSLIAAQCSEAEWRRLVTSAQFLQDAGEDFARAARTAGQMLGRNLVFSLVQHTHQFLPETQNTK